MDLWDFVAATGGYAKAHGAKSRRTGEVLSDEYMRDQGYEGF
jgi:hypothetical protein